MFERFTTQARSVVMLAQQEARELGHPNLGTHPVLLLAILGEPETAGGRRLSALGIGAGGIREEIRAVRPGRVRLLRGGRGRPAERRRRSGPGPAQGRGGLRARRARAPRAAVASPKAGHLPLTPRCQEGARAGAPRGSPPRPQVHRDRAPPARAGAGRQDCSAAKLLAAPRRRTANASERPRCCVQIAAGGDQSGRTALSAASGHRRRRSGAGTSLTSTILTRWRKPSTSIGSNAVASTRSLISDEASVFSETRI